MRQEWSWGPGKFNVQLIVILKKGGGTSSGEGGCGDEANSDDD